MLPDGCISQIQKKAICLQIRQIKTRRKKRIKIATDVSKKSR